MHTIHLTTCSRNMLQRYGIPIQKTRSHKLRLENGQRRAARRTKCNYERLASVLGMIENLGWRSLKWMLTPVSIFSMYRTGYSLVTDPLHD